MAGRNMKAAGGTVQVDLGSLNPKQKLFCQSRTRYTAYGGARGGGKTHVLRVKAYGGALTFPGIRILIVRKEYPELEQNIILPMRKMIPPELASYNGQMRMLFFVNGSTIKFGHYGPRDDDEYQGIEYDWIFMEEATQFTERQFRILGADLRGVNDIPKRMYLTCNPGGIGHLWVKRLFVDREYRDGEDGKDYTFIHATVEDNPQLMKASPEYVQMLELMPEDVRRAWRYGDWNALAGTFFPEFRKETHVVAPFLRIPAEWRKYRVFDYGLDMFACLWIAQDFEGRSYVYREVQQSGLIVSEAARLALDLTPAHEQISCTIAPPDMWNRQKDSGKSMAELFAENGLGLLKASNNRIQGWMAENSRFLRGGEMVVCAIPRAVEEELGAGEDDMDNISGFPRTIAGVKMAATLRENGEDGVKMSIRAVPGYDAAAVCAKFGGGGHKGAAGASIGLPLEEAAKAVEMAMLEWERENERHCDRG